MTGSLQSARGKYYALLNMKDEFGNRKQKRINLHIDAISGNKRKAEQALREVITEYERNHIEILRKSIPFCEYVKMWLEEVKLRVEQTTHEGYESIINSHIYPYFQKLNVNLDDLRYHHLQAYYNLKFKRMSANSLRRHHIIINQVLKLALKRDLIANNPADKVTLPKVEKFVGKFLSIEQGTTLLNAAKNTPMSTVIILAMTYGLRRSEIAGLKWDAVDFQGNTIIIRHIVTYVRTRIVKDRAKNNSSNRILPLNAQVREHLLALQEQQRQDKKLLGKGYHNTEYVCRWPDGHALSPDYMSRRFKALLKEQGLPDVRFHDLRHSCASYMLKLGCSMKEVSDWLGHSNIQTSMNVYAHLDIEQKQNIADKFNATFVI